MAKKVASLSESLMPVEEQAAIPARIETPAPPAAAQRGRPPRREEPPVTMNLRLPADLVAAIDTLRGGLVSRNAWIAMAVAEKLKREE
jgi:hypothetical protein